jgi:hypothetical protein
MAPSQRSLMKTKHTIGGWLMLLPLTSLNLQPATASAQGTAFSYQGRLDASGSPANGVYDLEFMVCDALISGNVVGGPLTNSATGVTNGLFTVTLDFGSGVFTGPARGLQLGVRTNGNGAFTTLLPRQQLLPAPYSVMASAASNLLGTLPAAQLSGTLPASVLAGYSGTVALTNSGNSFNGSFSGSFGGDGAGLTNVAGILAWQNVTGTNQQAQPNTGYLANNAAQVTITLPASPSVGSIVRVSGAGAGGWLIAQNAGQSIQTGVVTANYTNWNSLTNWTQTSASSQYWYSVAASADGTKLAAVVYGGGIYTSTNSGTNWTQTTAPAVDWVSIASSADGTKLAAVATGSGIYTSSNSGATWTLTSAPINWSCIAASADGTKLAAVVYGGSIYTSTNSGTNWMLTTSPVYNWISIASSADGTKLVAGAYGVGIYASVNSGTNWTPTTAPVLDWFSVASSADGTKLVAGVYGGGIYTSTNSGATWTQTSASSQVWYSAASSADGSKLGAVADGGGVYTSTNSGATWTQTGAPTTLYWHSIASSADGTKLVAAAYGAGIYTAQGTIQTATTPGIAGYFAGGQNSAIELQYIGNGQFLPLSYVGTLSAY